MALTLGSPTKTKPTILPPIATILAPLVVAPVAPAKPSASSTGPGVSYTPSIPLPAATVATPAAATPAPASAPAVPEVSYAPSMPLPAAASIATPTTPAIAAPVAAPVPEVSYAPSLIAPAMIVPPPVPETVAAIVAPILLPTEPAAPPPREPVAEPATPAPVQQAPAPAPVSTASTPSSPSPAAQPSLLDLYHSATRTDQAHALAGFTMPVPTIAPTLTPLVRTGAELIADAAYALVAGAGANRAGIGMLLDSVGAQASEDGNRRTPEAKKPSALAA